MFLVPFAVVLSKSKLFLRFFSFVFFVCILDTLLCLKATVTAAAACGGGDRSQLRFVVGNGNDLHSGRVENRKRESKTCVARQTRTRVGMASRAILQNRNQKNALRFGVFFVRESPRVCVCVLFFNSSLSNSFPSRITECCLLRFAFNGQEEATLACSLWSVKLFYRNLICLKLVSDPACIIFSSVVVKSIIGKLKGRKQNQCCPLAAAWEMERANVDAVHRSIRGVPCKPSSIIKMCSYI